MKNVTYIDVVVMHPTGDMAEHRLSMGRPCKNREDIHAWLKLFATGDLHDMDHIRAVQAFVACSGYGISNTALVQVSEQFNPYDESYRDQQIESFETGGKSDG